MFAIAVMIVNYPIKSASEAILKGIGKEFDESNETMRWLKWKNAIRKKKNSNGLAAFRILFPHLSS